jgi:hypothetical protein
MEKESKMKHSHSIPSTLRDLLSKLEFLGMITPIYSKGLSKLKE